ncbi:MAG: hypothetical protein ACRDQ1_19080, partial [Sciscionella sp.]
MPEDNESRASSPAADADSGVDRTSYLPKIVPNEAQQGAGENWSLRSISGELPGENPAESAPHTGDEAAATRTPEAGGSAPDPDAAGPGFGGVDTESARARPAASASEATATDHDPHL